MKKWFKIYNELGLDKIRESQVHPHVDDEKSHLFHVNNVFNGQGSEFEVYNFLFSIVLLFKPKNILETGTELGISTLAMAAALEYNGQGGIITTLDIGPSDEAKQLVHTYELEKYVDFIQVDSREYIKNYSGKPFDFAFFDSLIQIRGDEVNTLITNNKLSNIISFHDTSRLRGKSFEDFSPEFIKMMDSVGTEHCLHGIENHLSRGFRMFEVRN